MLKTLIFDFDGLLVDTETVLIDAWVQLHAEDHLPCDPGTLHHIVGHTDVTHDYWSAYPPEVDRNLLEERFSVAARRLTLAAPPLPGTLALLDAARSAHLKIGLASNSTHAHVEGHLEHRDMRGYFDFIACRDDVPVGKPEPHVYLEALRGLGAKPDHTLAFEDSVPGHVAAHRAGIRVVVVPNPSTTQCVFPHATLRLGSLADTSLNQLADLFTKV